jgi:hypothetical protein
MMDDAHERPPADGAYYCGDDDLPRLRHSITYVDAVRIQQQPSTRRIAVSIVLLARQHVRQLWPIHLLHQLLDLLGTHRNVYEQTCLEHQAHDDRAQLAFQGHGASPCGLLPQH